MSLAVVVLICAAISVVFGLLLFRFGYKNRTIKDEWDDDLDDEPDPITPEEAETQALRYSNLVAQRTREIRDEEDRRKRPQFP